MSREWKDEVRDIEYKLSRLQECKGIVSTGAKKFFISKRIRPSCFNEDYITYESNKTEIIINDY